MEHNAATLLVVDDNVDNADLLRDYLTSRGYHVVVAHSGDEALSQFSWRTIQSAKYERGEPLTSRLQL